MSEAKDSSASWLHGLSFRAPTFDTKVGAVQAVLFPNEVANLRKIAMLGEFRSIVECRIALHRTEGGKGSSHRIRINVIAAGKLYQIEASTLINKTISNSIKFGMLQCIGFLTQSLDGRIRAIVHCLRGSKRVAVYNNPGKPSPDLPFKLSAGREGGSERYLVEVFGAPCVDAVSGMKVEWTAGHTAIVAAPKNVLDQFASEMARVDSNERRVESEENDSAVTQLLSLSQSFARSVGGQSFA